MTDTTRKIPGPRGPSYFIEDIGRGDRFYSFREALIGSPIMARSICSETLRKAVKGEMQSCCFAIPTKHFKEKVLPLMIKKTLDAIIPLYSILFFVEVKIGIKRTKVDIEYDKYDQS